MCRANLITPFSPRRPLRKQIMLYAVSSQRGLIAFLNRAVGNLERRQKLIKSAGFCERISYSIAARLLRPLIGRTGDDLCRADGGRGRLTARHQL